MRVALTFDTEHPDRPARAGGEQRVLRALEHADAVATFFLQGRWVSAYPRVARRIAAAGHAVGNHSHHHAQMDTLSEAGLREDVRAAEAAITAATGIDPRPWFRCPFGYGMDDPRVLRALGDLGYEHVGWDVDPRDWEPGCTSGDVATSVLAGLHAGGGDAIVLLHSWPDATAPAVAGIVAGVREAGGRLVTLADLRDRD
jgi:peptidoglycan-N-acetylglucosamine deacetylase